MLRGGAAASASGGAAGGAALPSPTFVHFYVRPEGENPSLFGTAFGNR